MGDNNVFEEYTDTLFAQREVLEEYDKLLSSNEVSISIEEKFVHDTTKSDLQLTNGYIDIMNKLFYSGERSGKKKLDNENIIRSIFKKSLDIDTSYFLSIIDSGEKGIDFFITKLKGDVKNRENITNKKDTPSQIKLREKITNSKKELIKKLKTFKQNLGSKKNKREVLSTYQKSRQTELDNLLLTTTDKKLESMEKSDIIILILNIVTLGLYGYFLKKEKERIKSTSEDLSGALKKDVKMPEKVDNLEKELKKIQEQKEFLSKASKKKLNEIQETFKTLKPTFDSEKNIILKGLVFNNLTSLEDYLKPIYKEIEKTKNSKSFSLKKDQIKNHALKCGVSQL